MSSWDSSLAQKDDFFSFFGRGSGRGKGQIFSLLFFFLSLFGRDDIWGEGSKREGGERIDCYCRAELEGGRVALFY